MEERHYLSSGINVHSRLGQWEEAGLEDRKDGGRQFLKQKGPRNREQHE